MIERIARWSYRRRWRVLGMWLLILVGVSVLSATAGGEYYANYASPGKDSTRAFDLLENRFPERSGDSIDFVYRAEAGVQSPDVVARIDAVRAELRAIPHVIDVQPKGVSADGKIGAEELRLDELSFDIPRSVPERAMEIAKVASADGLQVEVGGQTISDAEVGEVGSEGIGLIAAAIILLVAFGSLIAMGLPLLTAVLGLGIASGFVMLLANVVEVPDWAMSMTAMIGLGVGIDYALFIITRYRTGLANGLEPEAAVVQAMSTAGRAVVFAGAVVFISLMGLFAMGQEFLFGTALSSSSVVLVAVLIAITLLPAMLGFIGRNIDRLRLPFGNRGATRKEATVWFRWSRVVQRRPWPAAIAGVVILLVLAAPVLNLRFGFPDAGNGPTELTTRRAFDLQTEAFGPGSNGPFLIVADLPNGADDTALQTLTSAVQRTPGIVTVMPPSLNQQNDTALITAIPLTGPQDEFTERLVHTLRDDIIPPAVASINGARVYVGGATAASIDQSEYMGGRLPLFIGAVVLLSFLLLMVVFHSVAIAIKAAIMNLLSIAAAYGVMAYAAEGGWLGDLVGITEPTPVPAFIPMLMFAILFGLSMDYEVFLLSRIREEYLRTGDNGLAVADGLATTAHVITAAAAIMVAVFAAFIPSDQIFLKVIGLGLATAIFIDATVVRLLLVPAVMELLGDRNWWMPRWLGRITPSIRIESTDVIDVEERREPVRAGV